MRLLRYGPLGRERPGILDNAGRIRDLSRVVTDIGADAVALSALDGLRAIDPDDLPLAVGREAADAAPPRLGCCLLDAPNFYCVGLNYVSHAEEAGVEPPPEPVLFSKATSALSGPEDPIRLPPGSTSADCEVELAVVIGAAAYQVPEDEALSYVAGYCLANDVSERRFQAERGGQWIKGKSSPSFGKLGPYLVTADEIANPQDMTLWLSLNGDETQRASTADMIFGVAELVSYASFFMTLRVGDVIATGTPAGVGLNRTPARFLAAGDLVEAGGSGGGADLGRHRSDVVA